MSAIPLLNEVQISSRRANRIPGSRSLVCGCERPVAEKFITAVEDAIDRVVEAPTRWRIIDEDVRRCLTHIFPYAILYTIESDYILVVAVMHCSREPGYWKDRLPKIGP